MLYKEFFCSLDLFLLFPLFISARPDLNFIWSFFPSVSLILPSLILSKTLKALTNLSNFASEIRPLHLYIKSSRLTFWSKSVISSIFLSASSLNIYFCFEINDLTSSSKACFLIALIGPWFWIAFICFSPWSSIVICFSKAFLKRE